MLKQQAGIATFRHTLSFTKTNRGLELNINTVNRYINTSFSINCIYFLAFFYFDTNILNKVSCLVCTWFQYLLYKFKRHSKLYLNSHPIKNLTFTSGYLVKFCTFHRHLSLETVFPALKLTQIFCINMSNSFLENWYLITNQKRGSSTHIPSLKQYPHNLTKYESKRVQKFLFSNFIVNWEKFGSTALTFKNQYFIYFMNWKKLSSPTRGKLNVNLQFSFCELRKNLK